MLSVRLFQNVVLVFVLASQVNTLPSNKAERDMLSAANPQIDDDFDIPWNINHTSYPSGPSTKLIPLPHVLCTGFSIGGLLEKCFPVGCICGKGAGICNLANKCIRSKELMEAEFKEAQKFKD